MPSIAPPISGVKTPPANPRIGSMFSGVGGLDLAITEALDGRTVFVADVCKFDKDGNPGHYEPHRSPCSVLAHRFPGIPNLGDVSLIDWSPWRGLVEILCAGFPCQDVSVAGGRAGLRDGTRTGLWSQVVRAITELQPRLVVLENVPGIFTASAAGDVEPCPICLGDGSGEHLRALDAVLADLAAVGFDADWTVVPASGVGAAHRRERWFCAAYPAGQPWSLEHGDGRVAADAGQGGWGRWAAGRKAGHGTHTNAFHCTGCAEEMTLLPTPCARDSHNAGDPGRTDARMAERGQPLSEIAVNALLPTPSVADSTGGHERRGGVRGEELLLKGVARAVAEGTLLPTPTAQDSAQSGGGYNGQTNVTLTDATVRQPARWGEYEPAIRRWEAATRPAPEPTKPNGKGNPKLSDEFDEWLMGYPAGWITDVPGVTWNEALKACGNGVVPQQGVAALRWLLEELT